MDRDRDVWRGVPVAYRVAKPLVSGFFKLFSDIEISGRDHIPAHRASVLAANHLSFLDPVLVSLAAHDNVRYLAVDELFGSSGFFDRLTGFWGAIPTPRERAPVGAIRTALYSLDNDIPVGVFPEGYRVTRWGETGPQRGAAWLSLLTGAPLVPIAMYGTQRILSKTQPKFRPAPIRVWVEEPIFPGDHLDDVDPIASMMRLWQQRMDARLRPWFG